jgi:hypothetical protein
MYLVYDGKYRITENPISLNWLYNLFASMYIPKQVPYMKPGEMITLDKYKVVKVD